MAEDLIGLNEAPTIAGPALMPKVVTESNPRCRVRIRSTGIHRNDLLFQVLEDSAEGEWDRHDGHRDQPRLFKRRTMALTAVRSAPV